MDDCTDNKLTAWRNRRRHMRLECRECEVICEKVVYPWQCLRSRCEGIYVYEDGETMYFGCLFKVFTAEFDVAVFSDNQADSPRRRSIKSSDPYGPVRVVHSPRPQCLINVEQAYETQWGTQGCCNPTFFHHPFAAGDDAIKLTVMPPGDDEHSES